MLVLSRKVNEVVRISDDIKITVVSVNQGRVRLGIEAPQEIPVHRQEIYDLIHRAADILAAGDDPPNEDQDIRDLSLEPEQGESERDRHSDIQSTDNSPTP